MKTANSLPPPEECNCFAVRAAARHVSQSYDRFLAPAGLRTTQYSILARLKRKGPVTINALAEEMVMDRTTLGRNILPLQRDGLIAIKSAASDRRAKELRLTKAGENRLREALEGWSQAQARFEVAFGEKRAAELRELLRTAAASEFTPPTQSTDR
ncbi:MAG: winged helix-turn-helix transcriptional regulator [Hyphomicrobiales bacterium]|jgi:DNA-binding MarR family transcriptional regulator|nr:winged helix-turn-helix transcriptional regulator [Hyphomicrobiales bacterium]